MAGGTRTAGRMAAGWNPAGVFWLAVAVVATLPLFGFGLAGLAEAWTRPEYSHGPVIPLLSFYMFLHEMKAVPPLPAGAPAGNRWPGVAVIGLALADGAGRQPRADQRPRLLRADRLGLRARPRRLRRAARGWSSGRRCCTSSSCCRCRSSSTGRSVPRCSSSPRRSAWRWCAAWGCRSFSRATSSTSGSTSCRWPRPARACATSSRS